METVLIDEGIRVCAAFDSGKVSPVWFLWNNRYYKIDDVASTWTTMCGAATLHHYTVIHNGNMYELQLNNTSLRWTLGKVCAE